MEQRHFDFEEPPEPPLDRRSVWQLWTVDEIYEEATTGELLRRFYEDERVERKSAGIHAESLATYVCMWANSPPDGGLIVLGIEDDGTITGCSNHDLRLVDEERRIRSDLVSDAVFTTKRVIVERDDGKPDFLVLYRVNYRHDKDRCKMSPGVHRQQSFDVLQDEVLRVVLGQRFDDVLEQCSSGILNPTLLSCTAEWLTRKAAGQYIVSRDSLSKSRDVPFMKFTLTESTSIDGTRHRTEIVSPNRVKAQAIRRDPKTADSSE